MFVITIHKQRLLSLMNYYLLLVVAAAINIYTIEEPRF